MLFLSICIGVIILFGAFSLTMKIEAKREIRERSPEELQSFETAINKIQAWNNGTYDPMIRTAHNK